MSVEITSRIPRDELLGLLNAMAPIEQQRITSEIEVVTPEPDLAIRFKVPRFPRVRMLVIASSFAAAFGAGLVVALLY